MAMFPGLPGDPPFPETTFVLATHVFIASTLWAVWWLMRRRASRKLFVLPASALSLALLCSVMIAFRNVGRWADLKRALIAFDAARGDFSATHGPIEDAATAEAFYRAYRPPTFSFSPNGPEVELVVLYWLDPPRVGIVWGHGGTAAFDLSTMICVYSD
jgi:hypothetical protein